MEEVNKKVELNEEQVEDVDGGLLAEVGLAAAMVFGQAAPATQQMEATPQVQQVSEQANTIELSKDNIKLDNTLTENGEEQTQKVKVEVGGVELKEDEEYTVKDNKATTAGVYTLTVEGKGMYSGKVEVQYVVQSASGIGSGVDGSEQSGIGSGVEANPNNPAEQQQFDTNDTTNAESQVVNKSLNDCTVNVEQATYNGSPQVPSVTITDADGNVLTAGTDYIVNDQEARQQEVGTYQFTINGIGNYEGSSIMTSFTINPAPVVSKDLSNCTINVDQATYNGSPQVPSVTITDADGNTLTAGTDYEVNTQEARQQDAGTYQFTIVGAGDYQGTSATANFTIAQATLGDENVQLSENLIYNKKEQTQKVTVTFNGMTLVEGQDFDVTNNVAKKKGDYTLTVTGKGNFTGTVNKTFTIYSEKQAVKTGENTNVGLYAGIAGAAAVAAAGLGALAVFSKKRSKR